jgi:ABC-2 type transport system permease protein
MVGAGSIAADNQANALMVYLSKPLTKGDYLLGKWMSIFLMVTAVALFPSLIFYIYCLLSYASEGFLKDEPWLFFRMIGACAVPGIIHASLLVGFSAWSKTPRMAGAVYAGFYFLSSFACMMVWGIQHNGNLRRGVLTRHLSVPGSINGIQQNVYGIKEQVPGFRPPMEADNEVRDGRVTSPTRDGQGRVFDQNMKIDGPPLLPLVLVAGTFCLVAVLAARSRIRAVEVVKG